MLARPSAICGFGASAESPMPGKSATKMVLSCARVGMIFIQCVHAPQPPCNNTAGVCPTGPSQRCQTMLPLPQGVSMRVARAAKFLTISEGVASQFTLMVRVIVSPTLGLESDKSGVDRHCRFAQKSHLTYLPNWQRSPRLSLFYPIVTIIVY